MRLTYSQFSIFDLLILVNRCIIVSEETNLDVVNSNPQLLKLKTSYNKYGVVYHTKFNSDNNKLLIDASKKLELPFNSLIRKINGNLQMPTSQFYQDAVDINIIIESYKIDFNNENIVDVNFNISKLLDELSSTYLSEKIENLNLSIVLLEIKLAQKAFDFLCNDAARLKLISETHNSPKLNRESLELDLNNYLSMVEIMKGLDVWKVLHFKLNEELKNLNKKHLKIAKKSILNKAI